MRFGLYSGIGECCYQFGGDLTPRGTGKKNRWNTRGFGWSSILIKFVVDSEVKFAGEVDREFVGD